MKYVTIDFEEFHYNLLTCPETEQGKATVTLHFLYHLETYMLEECFHEDSRVMQDRINNEILFVHKMQNPRTHKYDATWLITDLLDQLAESRASVDDFEWSEMFLRLKKKVEEKESR